MAEEVGVGEQGGRATGDGSTKNFCGRIDTDEDLGRVDGDATRLGQANDKVRRGATGEGSAGNGSSAVAAGRRPSDPQLGLQDVSLLGSVPMKVDDAPLAVTSSGTAVLNLTHVER